MLIQWVFELLAPLFVCVGLITQVIIPALRGTPFFPALHRHRVHREVLSAAEDVEQLEEQLRAARLKLEAKHLKRQLDTVDERDDAEQSSLHGNRGVRLRKGETEWQSHDTETKVDTKG